MNKISSIILILIFFINSKYCSSNTSNFEDTIKIISSRIPLIKNNFVFSFETLNREDIWNWPYSKEYLIIDDAFYNNYLKMCKELSYWAEYQTLYFYCLIDFQDELKHLVLLQRIGNNNLSNMYLINFQKTGKISSVLLLAKIEKSPIDFLNIRSELIKNKQFIVTEIYHDFEDNSITKDSIITYYNMNKDYSYSIIKKDSVRLFEKTK
jgi:hypothetical protein